MAGKGVSLEVGHLWRVKECLLRWVTSGGGSLVAVGH